MSSMNGNSMQDHFTFGEMSYSSTIINEQCLMVEQKVDDAIPTLNQSNTLTALDSISSNFEFMQESNNEPLVLDPNDDIYLSLMDEDILFSCPDYNEKSINCNLENTEANLHQDDCVFVAAPNCVASFNVDKNTNILEKAVFSNLDSVPAPTPSCDNLLKSGPPNTIAEPTKKTRRRRRCALLKEKLYMRTEPFSDEEMEKKRLNALKAKKNRTKQKDLFHALELENAELRKDLLLSKSKIEELEGIVYNLQENSKQKNLSLHKLREQLSTIIDK